MDKIFTFVCLLLLALLAACDAGGSGGSSANPADGSGDALPDTPPTWTYLTGLDKNGFGIDHLLESQVGEYKFPLDEQAHPEYQTMRKGASFRFSCQAAGGNTLCALCARPKRRYQCRAPDSTSRHIAQHKYNY